MNKVQTKLGALAACALPLVGCAGTFEEVRAPFHASVATGPSPTVTISNIVGELRVIPGNGDVVIVDATKYASNQTELANIDIVARPLDGNVSVQTVYRGEHAGGVRYDITVPRNASVNVTNVTGTIKVGSVGGSVVARTGTGTIDVRLGTLIGSRSVDLKSGTGTIDLHVAGDSGANVSASSALGSISSDFPGIDAIRTNIVGANAAGRIGDGSASVRLSVGTGSISIDRS